jgi:hypothetical protein
MVVLGGKIPFSTLFATLSHSTVTNLKKNIGRITSAP